MRIRSRRSACLPHSVCHACSGAIDLHSCPAWQLITRSRTHHGAKSAALALEQNLKELHQQAAAKKHAANQLASASKGGKTVGAAVAKALDLSHAGAEVRTKDSFFFRCACFWIDKFQYAIQTSPMLPDVLKRRKLLDQCLLFHSHECNKHILSRVYLS
jgi:hypothetical protein